MAIPQFQRKILNWYKKHKRDLPWRKTSDPYKILVSELMLQQTQISRVLPKYKLFLNEFPNIKVLAQASDRKLLKIWEGLGYWKRALFLRETARKILKEYKGKFPQDAKILQKLPGIGPYTARALLCFAFKKKEAFLDTNIRRVYLHFFFPKRKKVSDREILFIAQKALWKKDPRVWHWALFDYGAVVLKDKNINRKSLHYQKQSPFEGSLRYFRTKAVRFLLSQEKISHKSLEIFLQKEIKNKKKPYTLKDIVASLLKDKLIKKSKEYYFI